jgi:site-specific recombinase XerD
MTTSQHLPQPIPSAFTVEATSNIPPSRNPALVYIASLSSGSRRTMRTALQTIVDIMLGHDPNKPDQNPNRTIDPNGNSEALVTWDAFPWHQMEYQHTAAVRAVIASHYKKRTAVKMLSALRRVLKECWRLGYISVETYQRAIDLERIGGESLPQAQTGRHISNADIAAVLHTCADGTLAGVRDAAIIITAYNCGLRRAELAALQMEDVDIEARSLRIMGGKGDKERLVYMGRSGSQYLEAWLRLRGAYQGAVFGPVSKGDKLRIQKPDGASATVVPQMTDQAIYDILKRRARQAAVDPFSPHDIRRTFAGNLLDSGIDLATVQKLMGHSDPATTAGYDRRSEQVKKDAADRLVIPIIVGIVDYTK